MLTANQEENLIVKGLNPNQKEAVETIHGPLLIIAGAGSGKTKVLTHRVANLIQNGIKPWSILALTFTNKAAAEMKERIGKIVSEEQARQIAAGTFHSVFAMILRREATAIGYTNNFSIYDTDDSTAAIKGIMKDYNLSPKDVAPPQIRSKISWAKNQMLSVLEFAKSANSPQDEIIAKIYEEYQRRLFASNSMDFDDLLLNMIKLFKNEEILEKYQNRYKYLLVDEYQDTNRAQYLIINQLAVKNKNICVVGDDAQSIYKWRGADIKNILDFKKDYSDAKIVRLEQNYRSTKTIIAAADCVIKKNQSQLPKTLWTDNEEGELIELNQWDSDFEEAEQIAKQIAKELKSGNFTINDFAVLYRTNAQSLSLEKALKNKSLQYLVVGGVSFFARKEIKDVLAYLKILINPKDNESLLRVINEPPRGIGATTLKHYQTFAKMRGISVFEAFRRGNEISELQKRAVAAVDKFVEFVDSFIRIKDTKNPMQDIDKYIHETGLINFYKDMTTDEAKDRLNNIDQLFIDLEHFFMTNSDTGLDEYLQQSALITDADKKDLSTKSIKLMTLHSAKGLEFPHVFIAGMEQGLFPLGFADQNPEETEEERRLFYVGITRAEKKLVLSHCTKRFKFGDIITCKKSIFLNEIHPDYLLTNTPKNSLTMKRREAFSNSKDEYSQVPKSNSIFFDDMPQPKPYRAAAKPKIDNNVQKIPVFLSLRAGDVVNHPLFGLGKVDEISGIADNKQAVINFRSVGKKKLLIKFANLDIVKDKI